MASPESSPSKKGGNSAPGLQPTTPSCRRPWLSRSAIICLSILALFWTVPNTVTRQAKVFWPDSHATDGPANVLEDGGWVNWDEIEPSEKLIWHPCFSVFSHPLRCARLTVPMDYHRPLNESADNPKVDIALTLSPAPGRTEDPASYAESPLLINPGGPGGSGVIMVAVLAPKLRAVTGGDHDLLGFDPRGVGATTPKADCFEAPDGLGGVNGRNVALMNRLTWELSGHEVGLVNSSNIALAKNDVRSRATTQLCKQVSDSYGNNSIFKYSNTANVARDMVSIIEAWDDWRAESSADAKTAKPGDEVDVTDRISQLKQGNGNLDSTQSTKGKLVYWGFSYGTLLGATFASMFPDKVGRVILDGVVDADHYVEPSWMDSLVDADKILDKFFVYCHAAGPKCHFYRAGDTPADIETRYSALIISLQDEPKIAFYPGHNQPLILTAGDIKTVMFGGLYSPITAFPVIAELLNTILVDGESLYRFVSPLVFSGFCNISLPMWPDDAQKAVMCSDKRYKLNQTLPELQKQFETMASYSSFADVWMGIHMACNGWDIEATDPPMRWDDHPAHKPNLIKTSFPVLFLSNKHDPVTPLHAALKMTRKFVNASIVEQEAEGHCTLACTSLCTIKHLRAYLNEGIVPAPPKFDSPDSGDWATCDCEEQPWKQILSSEDAVWSQGSDPFDEELVKGKTAEEVEWMRSWSAFRHQFMSQLMSSHFEQRPLMKGVLGLPVEASWGSRCQRKT